MSEDSRYRWKEHGARIRKARTQAGHTKKRLAELIGVDAHTVWGWEAGRMRPNQENLSAIAYHCATTPASLEGLDARQAELLREAEVAFRDALVGLPPEDIETISNFIRFVKSERRRRRPGQVLSRRRRCPLRLPLVRPPEAAPPPDAPRRAPGPPPSG